MIIEFFGSTGSGKTTLANDVLGDCRDQGIDILMGADFVLEQSRLNWIRSKFVRTLCLDLIALIACLATFRNNFKIYAFVSRVIIRLPVDWFEKLNLTRNVLKKIGIYEIIRRCGSDRHQSRAGKVRKPHPDCRSAQRQWRRVDRDIRPSALLRSSCRCI